MWEWATKFFVVNALTKRTRLFLLAGACCALLIGGCSASRSVGAESIVQAIVCREGATLSIVQPISDSVVINTSLPINGMVTQATQIEVTIDGQFNSVVPLNAAATNFATTVQLSAGTHTIRLTAIDACQIANASDQVVVTYEAPPTSGGSVGGETATDVPAGGGVVIGDVADLPAVPSVASSPFERLVQPLVDLGRQLDLVNSPSATAAQQASVPQLVRFGFVAVGLGSIIFTAQIVQFASGFQVGTVRLRAFRRPLVIAIGAAFLALGFLL